MDYKNRSIPAESVTSFDVNKAIQRSLTKAVARHGLGLYVYAGEDLPDDEKEAKNPREEKKAKKVDIDTIVLAVNMAKTKDELVKIWQGLDPDTRVELQEVFSQRKAEL